MELSYASMILSASVKIHFLNLFQIDSNNQTRVDQENEQAEKSFCLLGKH